MPPAEDRPPLWADGRLVSLAVDWSVANMTAAADPCRRTGPAGSDHATRPNHTARADHMARSDHTARSNHMAASDHADARTDIDRSVHSKPGPVQTSVPVTPSAAMSAPEME